MTTLSFYAFADCTSLTHVTLRNPSITLADEPFIACTSLKTIEFYGSSAPVCGNNVFNGVSTSQINVYVHRGYSTSSGFCGVTNIHVESFTGTCGKYCFWTVELDGTLYITGYGAMNDYTSQYAGWYTHRSKIKQIVVSGSLTSIGAYAFEYLSNAVSAVLPGSLKTIGNSPFTSCSSLKYVYHYSFTKPETVPGTFITGTATSTLYVYSITDYDAISGITVAGATGSSGDVYWRVVSNVLLVYGEGSMQGTYSDSSVTGLTSAPWKSYKSTLTDVRFEYGVTSVSAYSFYHAVQPYGFPSLKTAFFAESISTIGEHAFDDCTGLLSIDILSQYVQVDPYAFDSCTALETAKYYGDIAPICPTSTESCSGCQFCVNPDDCSSLSATITVTPKYDYDSFCNLGVKRE